MTDYDSAWLGGSTLDTDSRKQIYKSKFGGRGLYIAAPENRNLKNGEQTTAIADLQLKRALTGENN